MFNNDIMYFEGMFDMEWGIGLDVDVILYIDLKKWFGENKLGKIY